MRREGTTSACMARILSNGESMRGALLQIKGLDLVRQLCCSLRLNSARTSAQEKVTPSWLPFAIFPAQTRKSAMRNNGHCKPHCCSLPRYSSSSKSLSSRRVGRHHHDAEGRSVGQLHAAERLSSIPRESLPSRELV